MEKSLRMFGCEGLGAEGLSSLSLNKLRQMLRDVAWRQVVESWRVEARSYSKLVEVGKVIEKGCKERCVEVKRKRKRRILTKLRGGTAAWRLRWADGRASVEKIGCAKLSKWRSGGHGAPFIEMH